MTMPSGKANHHSRPDPDWSWATILVVEDDEVSRSLLTGLVRSFGVANVIEAVDGADCLEKLAELTPDLVITDIHMPEMDGIELCRRIRESASYADIPILVQTAMSDPAGHLQCFSAGASDVLTKPLRTAELRARMRVHLENRRLVFDLRTANKRMAQEIDGARRMQKALMPKNQKLDEIRKKYGPLVEGLVEPSFSIGGDIWGILDVDDHKFALYSADFSGHGVMAALNTFRLHAIITENLYSTGDPALFMAEINHALHELLTRGQYATFFYAVIDVGNGTITWSGAGHPFPILISDGSWNFLNTVGTPLGLDKKARYANATLPFPPGSSLFIYSDGMSEAKGPNGHTLGEQSILDFLMVECVHPLAVDLDGTLARFRHKAALPLGDDLTAIWVRHDQRTVDSGPQPLAIAQDGLAEDMVSAWSAHWGMAVSATARNGLIRLVDSIPTDEPLARMLCQNSAVVETGNGPFPLAAATRRALEDGAVLLSMTTASVYAHPPCNALCAALLERGWITPSQRDDIWLLLQEATSNAVIHGNLGVGAGETGSTRTTSYWQEIRRRLGDPALSARRLTFLVRRHGDALDIGIADEGAGFSPTPSAPSSSSGRGIGLMSTLGAEVRWEDGGRRVVMRVG